MQEEALNANYLGRRAASIENSELRVTVLQHGGHIAEIFHKAAGVNPLWTPPWPTIEPFAYGPANSALYGEGADGPLLAGIIGQNLCLDIFGPPSDEEARAGLTAHGEGSVAPYRLSAHSEELTAKAEFPIAGLTFERRLVLRGGVVEVHETLKNATTVDRMIGWTQHVTLGPPFLERGVTEFRASATRSKTFESAFGADDYLRPAAEFDWPMAPALDGKSLDLRVFTDAKRSSAYTAHLMDHDRPTAFFAAFSPAFRLVFGYVWTSADFPWMGIWEENHSRLQSPWNGRTLTRGMEFGVSPMPETRQAMVERGHMFGVPGYRLLAAGSTVSVEYCAIARRADRIPESLEWPP